jgi:hypothetical protein
MNNQIKQIQYAKRPGRYIVPYRGVITNAHSEKRTSDCSSAAIQIPFSVRVHTSSVISGTMC